MDDTRARSGERRPPLRTPLITPSASPPVSRVWSQKDRPPPFKRPRLSSTPSSSSSAQPSSSSSSVADLRLESSSRLFQFWDQLAGRYNKPLDEDDIVDFRNFKIIKDRGVMRSAASPYSIGSLLVAHADPEHPKENEGDGNAQEEGDGDGEGDDDSADEIDLISPPPIVPVKLEYYKTWYVPPADEEDPEDAEAFREFEEAERIRRELFGDLDEEEDEEDPLAGLEDDGGPGVQPDEVDEQEEDDDPGQDELEGSSSPSRKPVPRRRKSRPPKPSGDESSEDELAAAEVDNTPIPSRQSMPPADDIIDLTDSPSSSPVPARRGRPPCRRLRLQSAASSRGRSKPKPHVPAVVRRAKTPERPPSPEQVLQLLTPPRSSSAAESAPDTAQDNSPASRAETPSPKFPKARLRYTPRPRTPSEDGDDRDGRLPSLDIGEPTATRNPFPVGPPKRTKKRLLPAKPEVLITTSPRRLNGRPTSTRPVSTEPASSPSMATVKQKSAKAKGRESAPSEPGSSTGASRVSRPRRSQSQPRGSARASTEESSSPQPPPPPKGLKRRRVSSLSSLSDGSPAKAVTPDPPPTASRSVRAHRNTWSSVPSGYSSDVAPQTSSSARADDEDDEEPVQISSRNRHRAGSLVAPPVLQPPPIYPPPYPPYTPRHHDYPSSASSHLHHPIPDERHTPFPQLSDPQAQYYFDQAWQSVSYYLMASGAFRPPPPPPAPSYPPGLPFPPSPWPPYTPSHRRHHTVPSHVLDTLSSEAGPSRSSTYSTPTRQPHPYPYSYDPRFSSSTLPPSSPIPSSPPSSSPILRPASVAPGQRSRSRGRRVSFKLDANDQPAPPTPPRHLDGEEAEEERDSDDEPLSALGARWRGTSASASTSARLSSSSVKGKGKARAASSARREEEEEEVEREDEPSGGRSPPRARTPGPPSRREQSVPRSSGKATSSTKQPKSSSRRKE